MESSYLSAGRTAPAMVIAAAALLALVVSGCGAGTDPALVDGTDAVNPLTAYEDQMIAALGENANIRAQALMNVMTEAESACMEVAGFDPLPVPHLVPEQSSGGGQEVALTAIPPEPDTIVWAQQYGYRQTEFWELQYRAGVLDLDSFFFVAESQAEETVDTRSEAQIAAWSLRFFGTGTPPEGITERPSPPEVIGDPEFEQWVEVWGCNFYGYERGQQHRINEQPDPFNDPLWIRLQTQSSEYSQHLHQSSEVMDAQSAWSACMADEGFSFNSYQEITTEIDRKLTALRPWVSGDPWFGPRDQEGNFIIDEEELAAVYDFEIAVAVADAVCATSHPYRQTVESAQLAYDQQLVEENREALEQWLAEALDRLESAG